MKILEAVKVGRRAVVVGADGSIVRSAAGVVGVVVVAAAAHQRRREAQERRRGERGTGGSSGSGGIIRWDTKRSASGSVGSGGSKGQQQFAGGETGAKPSTPTARSAPNPLGSASAFSFLKGKPRTSAAPAGE